MTPRRRLAFLALFLTLTGCASLLQALATASQGAQYLGSVVSVAEAGSAAYFARHPNLESERKVSTAVRRAKVALQALNAALSASQGAQSGDVDAAKAGALSAYAGLRGLLAELGVLEAKPPDGGAETDAPMPEPVALPLVDVLAERL